MSLIGILCFPFITVIIEFSNSKHLNDDYLRMNFATLLNNIVELNENRLGAIQKNMKSYNNVLSTDSLNNLDDEEKEDSIEHFSDSIPVFDDTSYRTSRRLYKYDSADSYESEVGSSTPLRRWYRPCLKRAAKRCREACRESVDNICIRYDCKKRVKRHIKKECKLNCKSKFGRSKYSSSESDY